MLIVIICSLVFQIVAVIDVFIVAWPRSFDIVDDTKFIGDIVLIEEFVLVFAENRVDSIFYDWPGLPDNGFSEKRVLLAEVILTTLAQVLELIVSVDRHTIAVKNVAPLHLGFWVQKVAEKTERFVCVDEEIVVQDLLSDVLCLFFAEDTV